MLGSHRTMVVDMEGAEPLRLPVFEEYGQAHWMRQLRPLRLVVPAPQLERDLGPRWVGIALCLNISNNIPKPLQVEGKTYDAL